MLYGTYNCVSPMYDTYVELLSTKGLINFFYDPGFTQATDIYVYTNY